MSRESKSRKYELRERVAGRKLRLIQLALLLAMVSVIIGGAAFQNARSEAAKVNAVLDKLPEGVPNPRDWTKQTPIRLYDGNGWVEATYGDVEVNSEFVVDGHFFFVKAGGVITLKSQVEASRLEDATRHFDPERWRMPEPDDVVYVVKSPDPERGRGHWVLRNVTAGSEVRFQGKVWAWEEAEDGEHYRVRDTGNVFARILDFHEERHEGDILELIVRYDTCGKNGRVVGSEEHPFYVLDVEDYLNMVDLEPGMRLKTDNGALAEVVSLKSVPGPMTLYNLTVEHVNNFYIYPEEGQPAVLVHNTGGNDPLVLYRVINESEYNGLMRGDPFTTMHGGYEGKQFWTSLEDAEAYARQLTSSFGETNTRVVGGVISNPNKASLHYGSLSDLDGGRPYVLVRPNSLSKVRPVLDLNDLRNFLPCG